MTPVFLALASAALFGAMTVAVRLGLLRMPDVRLGAAATALVAFGVALAATPFGSGETNLRDLALFALAGLLAPGVSQLLFTLAVRDAGAARASVIVGAAPLVTVALGLLVLDEPFELALLVGAALIVVGGTALVWERLRPESFRAVGIVWAIGCTLLFASRDTFVRWFSGETPVASTAGAAATLFGGSLVLGAARTPRAVAPSAALRPRGPLLRALVRLPLRGVLPRPRHGRLAARRDRGALGRRALGAPDRPERAGRAATRARRAPDRRRRRR